MAETRIFNLTVIVAALGYFVDIYDLVLFSIVRIASLKSIGVADDRLLEVGVDLINMQMFGMLVGGIIWGIIGDKRGRLSVLFGSILLYSLANIANGFVTSVEMYAVLRLLAGIGLAGELGAAITLVSEVMSKEHRGYGTTVVAAVGVSGAVGAAMVARTFEWQTAYFIGGGLGLALLILRVSLMESSMFHTMTKHTHVRRGDFFMLFKNRDRFLKYARCILIGVPIWYVIGILVTFSPEIMKELGATGPISAGEAIMYCYIGLIGGDLASGLLSQFLKSRKKVVFGFLILTCISVFMDLSSKGLSPQSFYIICILMGFAAGYWAVFVTIGSEQFGTNLRSTVTTTVPNFVRGAVVPVTLSFNFLKSRIGLVESAAVVGFVCLTVAFLALRGMEDTYGKELNYIEPT